MTLRFALVLPALTAAALLIGFSGCASSPKKIGEAAKPVKPDSSAKVAAGNPAAKAGAAAPAAPGVQPNANAAAKPATSGPSVTVTKHTAKPMKPAEPLIMENADRMEGSRSRGEYILTGKVRFSHGDMIMETERAVWQKDRNMVYCESGMKIIDRGAVLIAEKGNYDKNQGLAVAEGNVKMRDSSGDVNAFGHNLVYSRPKHLATLSGNPLLMRYYHPEEDTAGKGKKNPATKKPAGEPASISAADSAARQRAAARAFADMGKRNPGPKAKADSVTDTLIIHGQTMTYDDSLQEAVAEGNVRITREKMRIDCRRAEYHDQADSLYLIGQPQVQVDDSKVKGDIMRLGMHGEEIRGLLVKGAAQAHSLEPATDTTVARQSNVQGDSLFLAFKEKAIDSVQVFKHAAGAYYDVDKPNYVNRMSGEYMVLRFSGKQIQSANVLGGAKSTYYHFESKRLKGRNETQGDTIDFAFKQGRVDEVLVRGNAKGNYFGENDDKKKNKTDSAGVRKDGKGAPSGVPAPSAAKADTTRSAAASQPKAPAAGGAAEKSASGAPAIRNENPGSDPKTDAKPWGRK